MSEWQPSANVAVLKKRADILKKIRHFFTLREVMEVETPILASHGVTDIHLDNFEVLYQGQTYYLQTSPEYHMKRLLAAGIDSVYQMSKAFRHEQAGRHHNPEFTLLEWYRVGFDYHQLMAEVAALLQYVLNTEACTKVSYQQLFLERLGICPIKASLEELQNYIAQSSIRLNTPLDDKDACLNCLMSFLIEPHLGETVPLLVYDFPASQASLAKVEGEVALRFEGYYRGVELCNGFDELLDADEQRQRFDEDNQKRVSLGLVEKKVDAYLLDALAKGLPQCSGVALGVDRLLMLALERECIDEVISFAIDRA